MGAERGSDRRAHPLSRCGVSLPAAVPTVGIIANPLAGKDVRRLTSGASPVSDGVKIGAIRRAVVGALEGGASRVLISGDRAHLGERALAGLDVGQTVDVLEPHGWHTGRDTQLVAAQFRAWDVGAVISLGGDGTQRDTARGWRDVPLVPLAIGTNNVFPSQIESTVAGFAAGAVASEAAEPTAVTSQAKIIDVTTATGSDVALVDVCLVQGAFVGARAVWDPAGVHEMVVAIAEPASVGLSAIAAAVCPVGRGEPGGAHVRLGTRDVTEAGQCSVRTAVQPGSYADIAISHAQRLGFDAPVTLVGPGVLTLDGEREIVLRAGETAELAVRPDGPRVIDVGAAVALAQRGRYAFGPTSAERRAGER